MSFPWGAYIAMGMFPGMHNHDYSDDESDLDILDHDSSDTMTNEEIGRLLEKQTNSLDHTLKKIHDSNDKILKSK